MITKVITDQSIKTFFKHIQIYVRMDEHIKTATFIQVPQKYRSAAMSPCFV